MLWSTVSKAADKSKGPERQHPRRQLPPVGPRVVLEERQFPWNGQAENLTTETTEDLLRKYNKKV